MKFIGLIIENKLIEAKEELFAKLDSIVAKRLAEAKRYAAEDRFEVVDRIFIQPDRNWLLQH
mgnify:CR=1 FL=1